MLAFEVKVDSRVGREPFFAETGVDPRERVAKGFRTLTLFTTGPAHST